ncbi:MAG: nicotinate-nucleotide adenylyltransferase [Prevotellaceae bacterium]|jgi:nicotinate-nucleotide adenylyltransferase|nr:nicotinate-nucleotide adenylyltransferase [Prevotellaceae bacterium]
MKTGLFCGSFNPIHLGHLALANYLCEYGGLDEVWFVVSPRNPLKETADLLDDELRLSLVRLATAPYPRFGVCDVEFHLPRPSYTIVTLDKLKALYPDRTFYLMMGADNWAIIDCWREYPRLLAENRLLVYPRPGYRVDPSTLPSTVEWVEAPTFEISSTFIRRALREHKDVRYFLHPAVWEQLQKQSF